jgi:copper chaperone NosL
VGFAAGNVNRDYVLYVHDMAQTDWEQPDDTSLIDAREAWFVVGSERSGAMGPTLASFADQSDAEAFAGEHGGEILAFSEVRMEHLTMSGMGHSM